MEKISTFSIYINLCFGEKKNLIQMCQLCLLLMEYVDTSPMKNQIFVQRTIGILVDDNEVKNK